MVASQSLMIEGMPSGEMTVGSAEHHTQALFSEMVCESGDMRVTKVKIVPDYTLMSQLIGKKDEYQRLLNHYKSLNKSANGAKRREITVESKSHSQKCCLCLSKCIKTVDAENYYTSKVQRIKEEIRAA